MSDYGGRYALNKMHAHVDGRYALNKMHAHVDGGYALNKIRAQHDKTSNNDGGHALNKAHTHTGSMPLQPLPNLKRGQRQPYDERW